MDSLPPIKPRRLRTPLDQDGDALSLTFSQSAAGGCFLLFWLIGWSVGCLFLAAQVVLKPQLLMVLFGIPFWAAWFYVASLVLRMFFGRQRLSLSPEGASFESRVLKSAHVRRIPLQEIIDIRLTETSDGDDGPRRQIEFVALGENLLIDPHVDGVEHRWLVHQLNKHLEELRKRTGEAPPVAEDREDCRGTVPPSDSRWEEPREESGLVFEERGRLDLSALGGLLFINMFWNGIVGVFLCVLIGNGAGIEIEGRPQQAGMPPGMWWGLCLFLIPFEALGLMMLAALAAVLLEPLRITRWRFTDFGAACSMRYLSIGKTWEFSERPMDRLDIVKNSGGRKHSWRDPTRIAGSRGDHFSLLAVARDGTEICRVRDLTCGDALWMKGRLQEELVRQRYVATQREPAGPTGRAGSLA